MNDKNRCTNCDSSSMEECLINRHCKNWVITNKDVNLEDDENDKSDKYES